LYALDTKSTLNIYHEIFSSLFGEKMISVYTKDKELRHVFQYSKKIILSDNVANATIVLVSSKANLITLKKEILENNANPIMFTTNYRLLQESNNIVGAFYWKKGRSQLLFIKPRLDKYNIHLTPKYKPFVIDEL
jgi:hypothetical protein